MKLVISFLLTGCIFYSVIAQDLENLKHQKPVGINGTLMTSTEFYSSNDSNSFRAPFSYLVSGNFNLSVYGISMPFSILYASQRSDFTQPFNRIGFSPKYKWIQLHLGYRTVTHSSFTLAGHTFLGAGIDLTPGKLRFSYVTGRFRKKLIPNTVNPLDTLVAPARKGYSMKLGFGTKNNYLDFNFLKIKDDVPDDFNLAGENILNSQGNMVAGTQFRFSLTKHLTWDTEGAVSLLTKNLNPETKFLPEDKRLQKLNNFFTINETSEYATALRSSLQYSVKTFSLGLQYRRIEPNYQSFGAYYFNTDVENVTLNSTTRVFNKKLLLRGSAGVQKDNLRNNKIRGSRRLITQFNFDYNSGKVFAINGNYSNYSINQFAGRLPLNDTLKLYQSNRNISVSPRLTFLKDNLVQMVQMSYTYMDLLDHNNYTAGNNQVNSSMILINYMRNYQKQGFSLFVNLNRTFLSTALDNRTMTGVAFGSGKALFKNKLHLNYSVSRNKSKIDQNTDHVKGFVLSNRFSVNYRPEKRHALRCNINLNNVEYPSINSIHNRNESKILFSYAYTFH